MLASGYSFRMLVLFSAVSAAMENVKFETRCQIIINFYQNYEAKEKPFPVAHFAKINVPRRIVYNTIARV